MMRLCQILPNSTLEACNQEEFCTNLIKPLQGQWYQEQNSLMCSYSDLEYHQIYDERYNARYPCQAGIISGRLACGSNSKDIQARNSYTKVKSMKNYDFNRNIGVQQPAMRQATTITLAVLTTATLSNLPTNPTTVAPTITAIATEADVTAIVKTAWTTSIFHSIMAILMAKASILSTARLLEPDLVLVIWMGLSLPFLGLVFVLLVILTWREWEIRKVEERVARDCAILGVMPLPQWRELVKTMSSADIEKKLAMDLRLQKELQKLRREHGNTHDQDWNQQFRSLAAPTP
ncbi:hypothetical protein HI914_03771 [Erysiphe necator]|uniref:Uncharacterized protein n=1 Tax=Uncinula necator TaxID=52586 RepID=A0A0B1PE09_UNCNE|nr:hypothetical protein HI914_03771 [Erysiphe necator]KHJ34844.1 hypothetical protein EV44_g1615 [Erysiphe necator]